MCGRFALYASENEIRSHFHLKQGFSMHPRYNIAPTQIIPVIHRWQAGIEFCRWGFIPKWQKTQEESAGYSNARVETLAEKPAFLQAFKQHRCLIPASSYYEWRTVSQRKQPYCVERKPLTLMGLAGIYSFWRDVMGQMHMTCAIITQEAPSYLHSLHPRAPLVIAPDFYAHWLEAKTVSVEQALSWRVSFDEKNTYYRAVSPRMNRSDVEGPECVLPL